MKKLLISSIMLIVIAVNVSIIAAFLSGNAGPISSSNNTSSYTSYTDFIDDNIQDSNSSDNNASKDSFANASYFNGFSAEDYTQNIGNYPANIVNGGYSVQTADRICYTIQNKSNYLCNSVMSLLRYNRLNKHNTVSVNYYKDMFYYIDKSSQKIYKIDTTVEPRATTELGGETPIQLIAANDCIYYISAENDSTSGNVFSMSLNGENNTQITNDGGEYSNLIPGSEEMLMLRDKGDEKSIVLLNYENGKISVLYTGKISSLNYSNECIWFIRHGDTDEICRVRNASKEIEVVYQNTNISGLVVVNDDAYFILSDESSCVKLAADTAEPTALYKSQKYPPLSLNIAPDFLLMNVKDKTGTAILPWKNKDITMMPQS